MKNKVEEDHPSQDHSERFPLDRELRALGWRIFERREGEAPLWEKDGKVLKQSVILASLQEGRLESQSARKKREK